MKKILCLCLILSLSQTTHAYQYDINNPFWKIWHGSLAAHKVLEDQYSVVFENNHSKVKSHFLAIPKGKYISLSHLIDKGEPEELVKLIRVIPPSAEKIGLKDGYRIIVNTAKKAGTKTHNNAFQEVPHLHIHITGGECLGLDVEGIEENQKSNNVAVDRYKVNNSILDNHKHLKNPPFEMNMKKEELYKYAMENKSYSIPFINSKKQQRNILVFEIQHEFNIPYYFGIILLNEKNELMYSSFDEFAQKADDTEIAQLFKAVRQVAMTYNLDEDGYRVVSNSGEDSWNTSNIFQIFIAGGNVLGPTVANVFGNEPDHPDNLKSFHYYQDLLNSPHESCKIYKKNLEEVVYK